MNQPVPRRTPPERWRGWPREFWDPFGEFTQLWNRMGQLFEPGGRGDEGEEHGDVLREDRPERGADELERLRVRFPHRPRDLLMVGGVAEVHVDAHHRLLEGAEIQDGDEPYRQVVDQLAVTGRDRPGRDPDVPGDGREGLGRVVAQHPKDAEVERAERARRLEPGPEDRRADVGDPRETSQELDPSVNLGLVGHHELGSDPLPDTFVDKSQALVEGRPGSNGQFVAEHVQAKCASKYEAAPGGDKPASSSVTQRSSM